MRTLLAALLVATACARPAPPAPRAEIDAQTAGRIARAGVLRAGDVPGMRARTGAADPAQPRTGSCTDHLLPAAVAAEAGFFANDAVHLTSISAVAPTRADMSRGRSFLEDELAGCLERVLSSAFATAGRSVTRSATAPVAVRVARADATSGFRLSMSAKKEGSVVTVSAMVVAAIAGHAELVLIAYATPASRAPTPARMTALLSKVVARAAAAER